MGGIEWTEDAAPRVDGSNRKALLCEALARRPDSAVLHARLGTALAAGGAYAEAEQAFRRAHDLDPADAETTMGLADALAELDRHEEAVPLYRAVATSHSERFGARFGLARSLARSGHPEDAVEPFRTALRLAPHDFRALHYLVRILAGRGDLDLALAACDASHAGAPGNASALGIRAQLLVALGRREEEAALMDFEGLLRVMPLKPPEGFADVAAFNEALAASIRDNEGLEFEPRGRATRGGTQAGLSPALDRPEALLYREVQTAMEAYREDMAAAAAGAGAHPFRAAAPDRARLAMWTVVLREGGHQAPHIHPTGWLSAVYYVSVPSGGPDGSGSLVLGCEDTLLGLDLGEPPETRTVRPREGLLVLFPSFYYHRTVPTRTREERICVAFNMVVDG